PLQREHRAFRPGGLAVRTLRRFRERPGGGRLTQARLQLHRVRRCRPKECVRQTGKKTTREWSPRFDHGYSQIIDWFYKLADRTNSDEFEARFGKKSISFTGSLIIGRSQYLDAGERLRLEWRREHVVVHSRKIQCVTF